MRQIVTLFTFISSSLVVAIFIFLLYFSFYVLKDIGFLEILLSPWNPKDSYGLSYMIKASLMIAVCSSVLAFIYSVSIALSVERLKQGVFKNMINLFLNILSSIPTIVYGFVGVMILLPFMQHIQGGSGASLLSTSLMLSFVITPTMSIFFINSFSSVKKEYKTIIQSIGGDMIDYQLKILLPYRFKSILVGFIMGFARASGDTMIALMLAGNSLYMPQTLNDSGRTLTSHIALLFANDFDTMEFKAIFVSGLVLFMVSFCMLILIRLLGKTNA